MPSRLSENTSRFLEKLAAAASAEMAWKTEQIEEVQERIKKAEDWIKVLKALPVKDEFESLSLVETEKRLILMRKEEAIYLQESESSKLRSKLEATSRLLLELEERKMVTKELPKERNAQLQACDGHRHLKED